MQSPTLSYLTDVYFDRGAVRLLPELLEARGVRRPLVVTDPGLNRLGIVERLPLEPAAVFDGVETNPTEASVLAALAAYREAECDGFVAVGGGSPLDLAKGAALLVNHPQPLEQYALIRGGLAKITAKMPPVIAVPTTAGSGSEVGRAALLTTQGGEKLGLISPHLLPKGVICDPELTLSMPPRLTAATGMDAISHCIETYCSTKYNPVADAIALDGLARGCANIRAATQDGANLEARQEMMMAALQGGLAFQKGLGAVHSLSHPLGALAEKPLHHGTLNAIFMPHVLRFNFAHCGEKMGAMARRIGLNSGADLPDAFDKLNEELELPQKLADLGVTETDLEPLAAKAFADHSTPTNPRTLTVEDCRMLYQQAL